MTASSWLALKLYGLLWRAAIPLAHWHHNRRARAEPGYRLHREERRGRYAHARPGVVWLHAVSVGEVRAAQPLIEALLARPDVQARGLLVTTMTPTGRATAQDLYGERVLHATLPWDTPGATRRFMQVWQPVLGLLMETELWPNLLAAARLRSLPMVVVNGRLSERSLARTLRLAALARPAYAGLAAVAAQSADDARRFETAGAAKVSVCGNLKFEIALNADQLAAGRQVQRRVSSDGEGVVIGLISTRDDEEAPLLQQVVPLLQAHPRLKLLVVPRRPQRFDEVAELMRGMGLQFGRRSEGAVLGDLNAQRVLLGDTLGEMAWYLGCTHLAVLGGGWLPHGGSNLIEPCAAGCVTLLGPHMFNFAQATADAVAAGAVLQLEGASTLRTQIETLLPDTKRMQTLSRNALGFQMAHQGALARTLALIDPLL
ncbi:MAG TPA: 3-deoxy-D-manno-octulosonic acid transferase [Burkholderiaceae bacterium]|nr:3-deoxy-D-manno-octulosonic acid transferase [Burkholderiaceae bacterium]